MKTEREILETMDKLPPTDSTKFPAMTYESGWEEALLWVLEDPEVEPPFAR